MESAAPEATPTTPPAGKKAKKAKPDWPTQVADRVLRRTAGGDRPDERVVCASGISPSGPVHLGNLRELLVPHFVAEEIKRRGIDCEHLLSWDDYDRLRKVPAGIDPSFEEYVGMPLTAVPDPEGELGSWAERFKAPVVEAMAAIGVDLRYISQTEMYASGAYREQIITAIERRQDIDQVLGRFRTLDAPSAGEDGDGDGDETVLADSGAEDADDVAEDDGAEYWPYKVYCQICGYDSTSMTSAEREDDAYWIAYQCFRCGFEGRFNLLEENHGKLVWKVDWPMRWAYESVTFEPGGADHSSPGSSFTVGSELVDKIFDGQAPEYEAYSFVGMHGMGKMSSSAGAVPTPLDALAVVEPAMLRWMYVRKTPRQAIKIDFGPGIYALYDEWDTLNAKVTSGDAAPGQVMTHGRATRSTIANGFEQPAAIVPFRTLTSAVSVAAGDDTQTARIIGQLTDVPAERAGDAEPRLSAARTWLDRYAPPEERITVRTEPDIERLAALSDTERRWLELLLASLEDDWSLEGARSLVYGVPKVAAGLPLDTPPTPELKTEQREFFKLLYQLFLGAETGPRMPTLLMALGPERVRALLPTG
ncbi:MAG: lysine--tRNA ligase [Actinomycetota bacterium]